MREDAEKQTMEQKKADYNRFILLVIILASIVLTLYVNVILGINAVYTHFYYVPIILAGVWYHRKAIYLAVFLVLTYFDRLLPRAYRPGTLVGLHVPGRRSCGGIPVGSQGPALQPGQEL
jgi:hypothetical protein